MTKTFTIKPGQKPTEEQIKEELVKLDEVLSIVDSTYI